MTSDVATESTEKSELSKVLDVATGRAPNGYVQPSDDDCFSDDELMNQAREEELSRAAFDAVLERSSADWAKVSDPEELKSALIRVLDQIRGPAISTVGPPRPMECTNNTNSGSNGVDANGDTDMEVDSDDNESSPAPPRNGISNFLGDAKRKLNGTSTATHSEDSDSFAERAKYIPMRLSHDERKVLRLVEAALNVSTYTDEVDVMTYSRMKTRQRIHAQIRDLCSILVGLTVASDYGTGAKLVEDRDFVANEAYFQTAFEIGRRHKVANPEKMRATYGKLIHMLQDSVTTDIQRLLEFSCVKPMNTVYSFLEQRSGLSILDDPLMHIATAEIISNGKSRRLIQQMIRKKEDAVKRLSKRYRKASLTEEDIARCLYSIGDNNSYLRAARDPCDDMIKYLHHYFPKEKTSDPKNSLAIRDGYGSARLTHDHARQFQYVFQSLALWREICHQMYKLWYLSEKDLLSATNSYQLKNTGQGLNRVQNAPSVSKAMYQILAKVQKRVGSWVGSSVVHLGDRNVPNALSFIGTCISHISFYIPSSNLLFFLSLS